MWDKYAPVAHLERLVFTLHPKHADTAHNAQIPSKSSPAIPPVPFIELLPLPAPSRSAPIKHHHSSPHRSIVLCCRGSSADFETQCNDTLAAASKALEEAGAHWRDASGVIVQLADIAHFAAFNHCYARCVPQSSPPTRFSVCVSLEEPILFIISIQTSGSSCRHMHVESVSFWAPANIGPYSQAQLYPAQHGDACGNLLLVSGQIGLVPERMVLVTADGGQQQQLEAECAQVLHNIAAVVTANGLSEYDPSRFRSSVCTLLRSHCLQPCVQCVDTT